MHREQAHSETGDVQTNSRRNSVLGRWSRRGFTLIEVVLVMAIIVIAASLATVYLTRSFSGQNLKQGADRVRAEMGKARTRAMRTGDVYAFFYVPGGNQFTIGRYIDFDQVALDDDSHPMYSRGAYQFFDQLLPQGVFFSSADVVVDSRAQWEGGGLESASPGSGTSGLRAILLYGDGTSQNAKLELTHENGASIQITLRGLTGMASVSQVYDRRD